MEEGKLEHPEEEKGKAKNQQQTQPTCDTEFGIGYKLGPHLGGGRCRLSPFARFRNPDNRTHRQIRISCSVYFYFIFPHINNITKLINKRRKGGARRGKKGDNCGEEA